VTVDELEAETGYDFLSNLPAGIQLLVEANDQPPVAKWGGETSGVEGSPVKFDGTGSTDPDANDALTYEWNFGDGVTGTGAKPTHVFADNGVYTVVLTVKDHAGAEDSQSNTVTVSNVAPTAAFGNNGPVDEGSRFTLSFSGASDQSTTDAAAGFQYRFDCGSGFGDWGSSPTVNCATTDNGLFPVRGDIRDKDGGSSSYAGSVRVNNVAPTALYINNGPVLEGAAFTLGFSGQSDPSSDDAAAGFQYRFDCGDGFGSWSTSPNVNCQTSDDGTYHTHAEIADKDGASTAYAADVVVQNTPPTGTFATTAPVNEGGVFTLSISGSADASSADQAAGFSYRFDCGNGFGAWSSSPARVCTATDNPGYSTLAEIRDKDGGYNTYSLFSTVRNVNPSVVLSSSPPIYSGGTYEISGGFADLGQADAPWSYSIDWGNGTTSGSTTMQGAITGSRSYANAGNYTVTLRVTDKDGGVGSASTTLHVNRLPGSMSVNPNQINIRSSGNGQVIATVFGNARFDGAAIDISSVRIGQVSPDEKGNGDAKSSIADLNRDGIADLVVHFNRDELVSSGALGASTSELVLYANLTDGRQIEARGSVSTR
jgi:PKD repeat protein